MAGVFPGLEHAAELRAHRVDAAHGHGAATDGEVVRRQLPRPHEVSIGRLALAALPQPLAQAELGAGLLIARARQGLEPPCVVRGERGRALAQARIAARGRADSRPVTCLNVSVANVTSFGRTIRPSPSIQRTVGTLTML